MAAVYPATTKTFSTRFNFIEDVDASHVNDLQDEVAALQRVLGILPASGTSISGAQTTWGSVAERLDSYAEGLRRHAHTGADGVKLQQANTHENVDTDTASTSLHHTLGTSQFQAAAGNHNHDDIYAKRGHGHVISDVQNLQESLDSKAPKVHNHDSAYVHADGGVTDGVRRLYQRGGTANVQVDATGASLRLGKYDAAGNLVGDVVVAAADRAARADTAGRADTASAADTAGSAANASLATRALNADTLGGLPSSLFAGVGHSHNAVNYANSAGSAGVAGSVNGRKLHDSQFQMAPGGSYRYQYGDAGFTRNPSVVAQHLGGGDKDAFLSINNISKTECTINLSSNAPAGVRWINAIAVGT